MSKENIELVARLIGAFNQRDVDTFASITTPDFEWSTSVMAVEGEIFRGREEMKPTSNGCARRGTTSKRSLMSIAISATVSSCPGRWRDGGEAAARRYSRRWTSSTTFVAARSRGCTRFSIMARRCKLLGCRSRSSLGSPQRAKSGRGYTARACGAEACAGPGRQEAQGAPRTASPDGLVEASRSSPLVTLPTLSSDSRMSKGERSVRRVGGEPIPHPVAPPTSTRSILDRASVRAVRAESGRSRR